MRQLLNNFYGDRWIGREAVIHRPLRSPDLNPTDFYFLGHLKSLVYSAPVNNIDDLRQSSIAKYSNTICNKSGKPQSVNNVENKYVCICKRF